MNEYFLDNYVDEKKGTENVSYIFKNNEDFFLTGYKVLQSVENRGLVKCARLLFNGKIKIVYFSSQYISLQNIMSYLDIVGVRTVLRNLIANILMIQGNGFLKCENIHVKPDKIFIDRNTLEVYLIYLPIKVLNSMYDTNAFENELRTQLIKLLNSFTGQNSEEIRDILFELSNGSASLEQLHNFLKLQNPVGMIRKSTLDISGYAADTPVHVADDLVLESADRRYRFVINKESFIIGKSEKVDGVIVSNPTISRQHCKLVKQNTRCVLMDLNSSNGTFLNRQRIFPGQSAAVKKGDKIRVANMEFLVK